MHLPRCLLGFTLIILQAAAFQPTNVVSNKLLAPRQPSRAAVVSKVVPYEPSPLDPTVIYKNLAVIGISAAAFGYWFNVLVPAKRTELSLDKRNQDDGALGNYLTELKEDNTDARAAEKWLLADWLTDSNQRKAAALPFLPKAKWNSGDNPILAAAVLIMFTGVVFSVLGWA